MPRWDLDDERIRELTAERDALRAELEAERAMMDAAERYWYCIGKRYYLDERGRERFRWAPFGRADEASETLREALGRLIAKAAAHATSKKSD